MTVEKPNETGHVWTVNGTHRPVGFYVNGEEQPTITDAKPLEVGPAFTVDGTRDRPWGVYTLSARLKGEEPCGPELAAASVELREGDSYAAVLHQETGGEHRLSIYRYAIRLVANRGTLAQRATRTVERVVKPITLDRLEGRVQHYREERELDDRLGSVLADLLADAGRHLEDDDPAGACRPLASFRRRLEEDTGSAVTAAAAEDLLTESGALAADLGCG